MFRVKRLFKIPNISFGRLPTPSQISSYIKQCIDASQYDFHETEAFEVTGVITDDPLNRGSVTGTFINDPSQPAVILRPVQTAVLTVPVVGEHVNASEYNGQHFYTAILNRKGNVTENSMPGISGTYDPKTTYSADGTFKTKPVRPIQISEGCTLFEGRMGQSIHFDRNKKNNSPNVKLRANNIDTSEMKPENIDTDDSSIYLTTNGLEFKQTTFNGKEIKGANVLIKSDDIFITGRNNIFLEADEVFINAKKVGTIKMGDPRAPMIPTIRGDVLLQFQSDILTLMSDILGALSGSPANIAKAALKLPPKLKRLFEVVTKQTFLNKQVVTANPDFKLPKVPKIPKIPEIPKIPNIPNAPDITKLGIDEGLEKLKK